MSPFQKRLVLSLTIGVGLTRLLALARSLFDWDEALFASAVRDYDVTVQHPHPPGYPLFIAAAKLVHFLGVSEFRSLQVIVVLGAFLIFPALFFLATEIGFEFPTAVSGAAIFSFLPNVWIYGGTGFSDVPAMSLAVGASALLLRGRRDSRAFVLGALVLGAAAGIRPTSLLIGLVPAILGLISRLRARAFAAVAMGILLGGTIVVASYAGSILASESLAGYMAALRWQDQWVREVDSWRNPNRPSLPRVAIPFFLYPIGQQAQMRGLALLAGVSLVGAVLNRRRAPFLALVIFGPFALFAWLNLDVNAVGRYAISYMAVHAILAADGVRILAMRFGPRWASSAALQATLTFIIVSVFAVWTWPALHSQRNSDSPPVAALEWIRLNVPTSSTVFVHGSFGPHAVFLLPRHHVVLFKSTDEIRNSEREAWVMDSKVTRHGLNFVRPHGPLWRILRRRAFEASLSRAVTVPHNPARRGESDDSHDLGLRPDGRSWKP